MEYNKLLIARVINNTVKKDVAMNEIAAY
jgi:hypothetical protein